MKRAAFKTRARVVDLLGREQIADAPTALTELLKNAVDAQAHNVRINYISHSGLLEVSDDGLGMRPEDLIERWLVLATDSRHGKPDPTWYKYATEEQKKRLNKEKPFGEKGIGRLAVASLGNGVLVWTRWGKANDLKRSMALVHWHLFRYPKLNLEDIYIPYIEMGLQDDPREAAKLLCESMEEWYKEEVGSFEIHPKSENLQETIKLDLSRNFASALESISDYENSKPGTSFYILATTDEVGEVFQEKSEEQGQSNWPSEGMRSILGFCNPFSEISPRINIQPLVDDKPAFGGRNEFWNIEDFKECDHFIHLQVDKNGFAKGEIRNYKEKSRYAFQTKELPKRADYPGPFEIKLGYVPGNQRDSILNPDKHNYYSKKLSELGALYVYRNGIRVMPYGRQDTDFMEFEYRRNKNAGRYFFSHRRMFGFIGIDAEKNPGLVDKAGREGFIKNKFYRGLYEITREIFIDLADSYFGKKSKKYEEKGESDSEIKSEIEFHTKHFLEHFKESRKHLNRAEKKISSQYQHLKEKATELQKSGLEAIDDFTNSLENLRESFRNDLDFMIDRLPNLARPSDKNLAAWDSYLTDREKFEKRWDRDLLQLQRKLDSAIKKQANRIKYLKKLEDRLEKNETRLIDKLTERRNRLVENAREISERKGPSWLQIHSNRIKRIPRDKLGTNPARTVIEGSDQDAVDFEEALLQQDILARTELIPYWDGVIRDLERISSARSIDGAVGELTREIEKLRERESVYAELAQIGLIVEGIDHEYRVLFQQARNDFKKIRNGNYATNESAFRHLENVFSYINEKVESLSPLYRTGRKKYETVTGSNIAEFLRGRFDEEISSGIMKISKSFSNIRWQGTNRSVLYGAIINVVNNAMYWIEKSSNKKEIRFTIDPIGFVISDSGPGVTLRDAERIFEPFFSRKPSGRGLGLYLAKTALQQHGMDLILADGAMKNALQGANFIFKKPEQDD